MNQSRGFSLIELAITVAVIGILTAFAIPIFHGITVSSEKSALELDLLRISAQANTERPGGGDYPATVTLSPSGGVTGLQYFPDGRSFCASGAIASDASYVLHIRDGERGPSEGGC